MNEELETGRSEMKSITINIIDRMAGELLTRGALESDEVVQGKMKYGYEILMALRRNLSKISCFGD